MGAIVAPFDDNKMSAGISAPDHRHKAAITPRMLAQQPE
jgi:hypothetical protein